MRRTVIAVVVVMCLFSARPVTAAPLTINFEGYFGYYDYLLGHPSFFDELDALAALGIYAGGVVYRDGLMRNASRVYLSLTIDDAVLQDPWTNWVLHAEFSLGPLRFSIGPSDYLNLFGGDVQGSSLMVGGVEARPRWVAVQSGGGLGSPGGYQLGPDMQENLAHVWEWRAGAIMTWGGLYSWWAFWDLTPTRVVSVPEPSTLTLLGSAVAIFVVRHRRRSKTSQTRN